MGKLINEIMPLEEIIPLLGQHRSDEKHGEKITRLMCKTMYKMFEANIHGLRPKHVFSRPSRGIFREYLERNLRHTTGEKGIKE